MEGLSAAFSGHTESTSAGKYLYLIPFCCPAGKNIHGLKIGCGGIFIPEYFNIAASSRCITRTRTRGEGDDFNEWGIFAHASFQVEFKTRMEFHNWFAVPVIP